MVAASANLYAEKVRPRIQLGLAAAVIAFIGWMAWQVIQVREPVYRGKSLTVWLEQARASDWADRESDAAIAAIGGQAVPTLLDMSQTRDSASRQQLNVLLAKQDWVNIHVRTGQECLEEAEYGFKLLGSSAKPAVPKLARRLKDHDPETRCLAAHFLGLIGPGAREATPALTQYIDLARKERGQSEWNEKGIFCAVYALGQVGAGAKDTALKVSTLTNDSTWFVWSSARASLIKMGFGSVDQVLPALGNPSDSTNWLRAGLILEFLGTNGQPAVPDLLWSLQATNPQVIDRALQLLAKVHCQPEQCLPAITPFLRATNSLTRLFAIEAIRSFGSNSVTLAPIGELVRCLTDPDPTVQSAAKKTLWQLRPNTPTEHLK